MVAPHRARCNEARRAELRRAKVCGVWGVGWRMIFHHGHRRCPIILYRCRQIVIPVFISGVVVNRVYPAACFIIGHLRCPSWWHTLPNPTPSHDAIPPYGLHCIALDAGLPSYRCCYITTRLLFLFKLVMESSFGLRSLEIAIRQG